MFGSLLRVLCARLLSRCRSSEFRRGPPYYVHPTAAGERKYADVISTALAAVGIGDGPHSDLMALSAPFAWAPIPSVTARSGTLTATWDAVDYASAQDVHVVDMTATEADGGDHSVVARVKGTTYSLAVEPGHRYRVWLAPVKTNLPMGTSSMPVTVLSPRGAARR